MGQLPLAFDKTTGCLPADPPFHDATVEEVRKALVEAFQASERRPRIFAAYVAHTEQWTPLLGEVVCEQWMNGSFVTSKLEPCDVDLLTLASESVINGLDPDARAKVDELFLGPHTPKGGLCHAFLVPVAPPGTPGEQATREQLDFWRRWFGRQRPRDGGHAKGIVRLRGEVNRGEC